MSRKSKKSEIVFETKIGITSFMDMHSGGDAKITRDGVDQDYIYIEAPQKLGVAIFKELYDRDPDNVTCRCCGEDYSVSYNDNLTQATGYARGCEWSDEGYIEKARYSDYKTIDEYLKSPQITFIPWSEAKKALGIPD